MPPHWILILRSIIITMGFLWLPIEAYEGLSNSDAEISYWVFVTISVVLGGGIYFIDGFLITGFLKREVIINPNNYDTNVVVKFGNLFEQEGWKAIAVNDFFDSEVDEELISSTSLHGHTLNEFWPDNVNDWQQQIAQSLAGIPSKYAEREKGRTHRYDVGTTAQAKTQGQKFFFVSLGKTDISNNVTKSNAEDLIIAVRGMLKKARASCSNEPLNIPLLGSGLSRIGVKTSVLVDLILTAIFEETRDAKVTSDIAVILPDEMKGKINLKNYTNNWN